MASRLLSKTRYLNGRQCPRLLWITVHEPARLPETDAVTQHIFDQGHLVGELAKKLFPEGIDVPNDDFRTNLFATKRLMKERVPVFEAGVMAGRLFARADIMNPVDNGRWDIIEVKSSTSVKDVNIADVAFQRYCWESAGVGINRCYLACINNQYIKHGAIIPEEFFIMNDITEQVEEESRGLPERVTQLLDVMSAKECPVVDIGTHCYDPYDCALAEECWQGLPEHSIFTLYHGGKKSQEYFDAGIINIVDIPVDDELNDKQRIQFESVASGQVHIDRTVIRNFLDSLAYPLSYLDFETFSTAVPLFDGTRPYQNIPFQFSLHIQPAPGAATEHYEFLSEPGLDPRPALLDSLKKHLAAEGSIIAYNKSFEERVIKELGEAFPEYAAWAEAILPRFIDLIIPFRSFAYYHPDQLGSASLKKVLPAVTGSGYQDMAIAKGDDASLKFLTYAFGETPTENPEQLRRDLLAYCKLDTEGMVRIVEQLDEMTQEPVQYEMFPQTDMPVRKKTPGRKRK